MDETVDDLNRLGMHSVSVNQCVPYDDSFRRTSPCPELYRTLVILSDGSIVPCCGDYDGTLTIGSVLEEIDLGKHYRGDRLLALRKALRTPDTMPPICRQCNVAVV